MVSWYEIQCIRWLYSGKLRLFVSQRNRANAQILISVVKPTWLLLYTSVCDKLFINTVTLTHSQFVKSIVIFGGLFSLASNCEKIDSTLAKVVDSKVNPLESWRWQLLAMRNTSRVKDHYEVQIANNLANWFIDYDITTQRVMTWNNCFDSLWTLSLMI